MTSDLLLIVLWEDSVSEETNALSALKNAWTGAVEASEKVRALAPAVQALDEHTPIDRLDLEDYHRLTVAQATAVMALRGLIEQLRRRNTQDASS